MNYDDLVANLARAIGAVLHKYSEGGFSELSEQMEEVSEIEAASITGAYAALAIVSAFLQPERQDEND